MLRRTMLLAGCLFLLAGIAAPTAGPAGDARLAPPLPRGSIERLERGEVVLLAGAERDAPGTARAAVLIRAPAERVWSVMIDCPRAAEFVPNLRRCRVLEQGEGRRLVEHRVKVSALLPELTYRFEERWEEARRIAFRRVGGDLASMSGSWDLDPRGEAATLVRYTVTLDPGFPVPGRTVRRALHHDLPRLLGALRDRVESGERGPR